MSAILPSDLVEFLTSGVSILVATRDAEHAPEAVRAFAPVVSKDRRFLEVIVPRGLSGDRTIANLEADGHIAIAFSRAIDHISVQVKGRCTEIRQTTESDRPRVERYHAAYVEGLYLVGMPRKLTSRFRSLPGAVITVEVTAVFNQTPGPGAGGALEKR